MGGLFEAGSVRSIYMYVAIEAIVAIIRDLPLPTTIISEYKVIVPDSAYL